MNHLRPILSMPTRPAAQAKGTPSTPAYGFNSTTQFGTAATPYYNYGPAAPSGTLTPDESTYLQQYLQGQGILPNRPWETAPPSPQIALGRMNVTCAQWAGLPVALKAALVRGVLEGLGFTSLNGLNRGDIVYKLVDQLNNYCVQQAALSSGFAGIRSGMTVLPAAGRRGGAALNAAGQLTAAIPSQCYSLNAALAAARNALSMTIPWAYWLHGVDVNRMFSGPHGGIFPGPVVAVPATPFVTYAGYAAVPQTQKAEQLVGWYRIGMGSSPYLSTIDWTYYQNALASSVVPLLDNGVRILQANVSRVQQALNTCLTEAKIATAPVSTTLPRNYSFFGK